MYKVTNLYCHIYTKFPTENVVKYLIVTASRIYLIYIHTKVSTEIVVNVW